MTLRRSFAADSFAASAIELYRFNFGFLGGTAVDSYAFSVQFAAALFIAVLCPTRAIAGTNHPEEPTRTSVAASARPQIDNLLPCPLSIPCRATAPASKNGADRQLNHLERQPKPDTVMLPCPESVPCIATIPSNSPSSSVRLPPMSTRPDSRYTERNRAVRKGMSKGLVLKIKPEPVSAKARETPAQSKSSVDISLTNSSAARNGAEQSLREADRKLAMAGAAGVGGKNARTYDQAIAIQRMAQAAMQKHDYAAAQALGNKAGRLAAVIKPR